MGEPSKKVEGCPFVQPNATTLASANEDRGVEGNPLPVAFETSVDSGCAHKVGRQLVTDAMTILLPTNKAADVYT